MTDGRPTRLILAGSLLTALMIGQSCMSRTDRMDVTGFAAMALLAGALVFERSVVAAWRRDLSPAEAALSGLLLGMPLSFFILQHRIAVDSGASAVARGSERVVSTIGALVVTMIVVRAWRHVRNQRT